MSLIRAYAVNTSKIHFYQTRRYDGTDEYDKRTRDAPDRSTTQTNTATPTDSSITGSPDSTDYTSDEYLRLPDKMSPNVPCPMPTRVSVHFRFQFMPLILLIDKPAPFADRERFIVGVPGPKQSQSFIH